MRRSYPTTVYPCTNVWTAQEPTFTYASPQHTYKEEEDVLIPEIINQIPNNNTASPK